MKLWLKCSVPILIGLLLGFGFTKLMGFLFDLIYNNLGEKALYFIFCGVLPFLICTTISWAYRKSKGEE